MLLSQGWTPGSLLGATNAPHAHLHLAANASHIKVTLKDNNLGLGAKRRNDQSPGECTGLNDLQGLLGRLNGKSEAVLETEQKVRDDRKRAAYAARKFGALRFVSGGILVGDRILELGEGERARLADHNPPSFALNKSIALQYGPDAQSSHSQPEHLGTPLDLAAATTNSGAHATEPAESDLKVKKSVSQKAEKKIRRAEKAQRKLDRQINKKVRGVLSGNEHTLPSPPNHQITQAHSQSVDITAAPVQVMRTIFGGRHAVRQRYIQQKKMAMMDPKALNEVRLTFFELHGFMPTVLTSLVQILMVKN